MNYKGYTLSQAKKALVAAAVAGGTTTVAAIAVSLEAGHLDGPEIASAVGLGLAAAVVGFKATFETENDAS